MGSYFGTLPAQAAAGVDVATEIGAVEITDDTEAMVSRILLSPPAGFTAVTGQATNNVTVNFRQLRGGSPLVTFASVTLNSGTNLAAETPLVVPVTGQVAFQQDDVIDVVLHQNGTGLAVGAGVTAEVELI